MKVENKPPRKSQQSLFKKEGETKKRGPKLETMTIHGLRVNQVEVPRGHWANGRNSTLATLKGVAVRTLFLDGCLILLFYE